MEAFQFFEGSFDSGFDQVLFSGFFACHRCRNFDVAGHGEVGLAQGGLEAFVDLVIEELFRGFGDKTGELFAHLLRVRPVVDLGGQELDWQTRTSRHAVRVELPVAKN